jgi:hypothetical protein
MLADTAHQCVNINRAIYDRDVTSLNPAVRVQRSDAAGDAGINAEDEEVFTPATEKEIQEYREKHAQWLKQCDDRLRNLHQALRPRDGHPVFVFAASNDGTRPANDALVTFRAMGQFRIIPPPYRSRKDDEKAEKRSKEGAILPSPPAVPRGRWDRVLAGQLGAFDALQRFQREFGSLATAEPIVPDYLLPPMLPETRDPNGFYYKPNRPRSPGEEFSLECQQWRHGVEPERFVGEIRFEQEEKNISGAIECRIHAENLSQSAAKLVPVHIRVRRVKVLHTAEEMVARISR